MGGFIHLIRHDLGLVGFIIPVLWHAIDIGVYIEVVYTAIGIVAV